MRSLLLFAIGSLCVVTLASKSCVFSIDCSDRAYCVEGVCEEMNGYAAIRERSNRCLPLLGLVCPRGFACNMANNWCEKLQLKGDAKKMPFSLLV